MIVISTYWWVSKFNQISFSFILTENVILTKSLHLHMYILSKDKLVLHTFILIDLFSVFSQNRTKKVGKHEGINFVFLNVVVLNVIRLFKLHVRDLRSRKSIKRYLYLLCRAIHLILAFEKRRFLQVIIFNWLWFF